MHEDRYGGDVLAGFQRRRGPVAVPTLVVERGHVLEDPASGFVGAVVRVEDGLVELEDRHGSVRSFALGSRMLVDGRPVSIVRGGSAPTGRARTASGSFAVADRPARIARASRIFVEGRHDAELVERVWGDDLRVEGVVVELLEGVDALEDALRAFGPAPGRRAGVLVDHLVAGSKESRIAESLRLGASGAHVLVVGHSFVDIWQAVKPGRLGIPAWPAVPRTVEWKRGVCAALGWPHHSQADIARAWQRILGRVDGYGDLEPELLARVERLIDFVTEEPEGP